LLDEMEEGHRLKRAVLRKAGQAQSAAREPNRPSSRGRAL
jgi:hypothetical protein